MKMQQNIALALVLVGSATLTTLPANAEALAIPLGQQGEHSLQQPPKGTNKAQVEAVYGEPLVKHGPTGQPPIYYWEYADYTVYFEGNFVLHTVLKHEADSE